MVGGREGSPLNEFDEKARSFNTPFEIQRTSETGALESFSAFLAVAVRN